MNSETIYDIAVIGAGISGLLLAQNLPDHKIVILEKSKAVGGRVATRRLGGLAINHGARKLKAKHPLLQTAVQVGIDQHLLKMQDEWSIPITGINQWTKLLAQNHEILKECLIHKIVKTSAGLLELRDSSDQVKVLAKRVVISAPAPQAYDILKKSGLDASNLLEAKYSSAIQFLALLGSEIPPQSVLWDICELKQHSSFVEGECYHLEYLAHLIKDNFELDRETIQSRLLTLCNDEGIKVIDSHVHKWRYSEVITPISSQHQIQFAQEDIYLIGDYFSGNDLNAAANSVEFLMHQIDF